MTDPSIRSEGDRRFIEESFPVKEVSIESAREKNIRHGHVSTLHIWWARRPLAASRATTYAALTPTPNPLHAISPCRTAYHDQSGISNLHSPRALSLSPVEGCAP